ncbi:hypothetical protein Pelo_11842 [Pelomyxa schiedti]|nr:hypothetical protein Pelo_11842 [Pelomyxa schiedti]
MVFSPSDGTVMVANHSVEFDPAGHVKCMRWRVGMQPFPMNLSVFLLHRPFSWRHQDSPPETASRQLGSFPFSRSPLDFVTGCCYVHDFSESAANLVHMTIILCMHLGPFPNKFF